MGAGFLLQPPGQAVLKKLDALDPILNRSVPILGLQSKTTSGKSILDLDYRRLKGEPRHGLGVHRNTIYEALLNTVKAQDLINVYWGHKVDKCLPDDKQVSIYVNDTKQDYDLCILTSGSNSHLADTLFKHRIKKAYQWGCLWTNFELPQGLPPNILQQRCRDASKMMGILPVTKMQNKYEAVLYWSMKVKDLKAICSNNFTVIKEEIKQFWPEAGVAIEPLDHSEFIPAFYNDVWTPKPYHGRLVAIGDISHGTSPQLGQGCTMALLDSWLLAKSIAKNFDALEIAIDKWWKLRRYQLAYVRHLSRFLTPLFQSENKSYSVFRDWFMAPIGHMPLFYQLQLKTLASEVFLTSIK